MSAARPAATLAPMDTTTPAEYTTEVGDVRRVPLARIAREMPHDDPALDRVLPRSSAGQVPVAAFNSSI